MKKILLVEDDDIFAVNVMMKLEAVFGGENIDIQHCVRAQDARLLLDQYQPDIILIDLVLEDEKSGVILGQLAEQKKIPVIFMTAFKREDLFKMALTANPSNYLQKPFTELRLKNAINLALSSMKKQKMLQKKKEAGRLILLKGKKGVLEKLSTKDIVLLEAFGNYCHIHTVNQRYTHRMTLKTYPKLVGEDYFVRIQRNYVINIIYLERINTREHTLTILGKTYSFSPKYKAGIIKKFSGSMSAS